MANHKSAEKRVRQRAKRTLRNRQVIGSMRTAVRKARTAVAEKTPEAPALVKGAIALINRAVTKNSLPRQTAARYISRLQRLANKG